MTAAQKFSVESCMKRTVQVVLAVFCHQCRYQRRWSSSSAQFAADGRIIALALVADACHDFIARFDQHLALLGAGPCNLFLVFIPARASVHTFCCLIIVVVALLFLRVPVFLVLWTLRTTLQGMPSYYHLMPLCCSSDVILIAPAQKN